MLVRVLTLVALRWVRLITLVYASCSTFTPVVLFEALQESALELWQSSIYYGPWTMDMMVIAPGMSCLKFSALKTSEDKIHSIRLSHLLPNWKLSWVGCMLKTLLSCTQRGKSGETAGTFRDILWPIRRIYGTHVCRVCVCCVGIEVRRCNLGRIYSACPCGSARHCQCECST